MSGGFSLEGELDLLLPIMALLPLTAILLVSQANPYQTLVLRGILGSVATLVYALLGAPDVALTEALVGTLLSTTLYAVALRSSMALRLVHAADRVPSPEDQQRLSRWIAPLNLRLRLVPASASTEEQPSASHGWWEAERTLVLRHPALHRRLRESEGYAQWLAAGGDLQLKPSP
jgi:putative multicomponent Na+:H+ antiporter subunit B